MVAILKNKMADIWNKSKWYIVLSALIYSVPDIDFATNILSRMRKYWDFGIFMVAILKNKMADIWNKFLLFPVIFPHMKTCF